MRSGKTRAGLGQKQFTNARPLRVRKMPKSDRSGDIGHAQALGGNDERCVGQIAARLLCQNLPQSRHIAEVQLDDRIGASLQTLRQRKAAALVQEVRRLREDRPGREQIGRARVGEFHRPVMMSVALAFPSAHAAGRINEQPVSVAIATRS